MNRPAGCRRCCLLRRAAGRYRLLFFIFYLAGNDVYEFVYLIFGNETKGLPEPFLQAHSQCCVKLPMREQARSLNLSNSVAVGCFEALRQLGFPHLKQYGKMKP